MKQKLDGIKQSVHFNYTEVVALYQEQITTSEQWVQDAKQLLEAGEGDAQALLKKIEDDTD